MDSSADDFSGRRPVAVRVTAPTVPSRRPARPGRRRGHIPRHLDIPSQQPYTGQVITQQRRLDLLRRFAK
jgi:hypothetical protein